MNDAFAERVYPTIIYMLDLLEQIEEKGTIRKPAEEKARLKQYLGQLDARGPDQRDFELAQRALVYWIDEMLVHSNWAHASVWEDSLLERELYGSAIRAEGFFERARVAKTLNRPDALECYFWGVALGFLGIYRKSMSKRPGSAPPAPPKPSLPPEAIAAPYSDSFFHPGGSARQESVEPETDSFDSDSFFGDRPAPPRPRTPPPPMEPAAPPPPERGVPSVPTGALDLPPTIAEWTDAVLKQILPRLSANFDTDAPSDTQRDPRPLRGQRLVQRAGMLLGMMFVLTVLLGTLWAMR